MTEKLDIAIIEIPKYKKYKGKNKKLDAWVKFIDKPEEINMDEIKGDKALQDAKKLLEDISEDDYEQDLAFKRDLFLMDKVAIEAAGYDKGLEEGMQQGIEKQKLEIAKKMLDDKLDIELIMQYTGLTKEEIEKLK
ncbi:MAG: Rpn family recombination-promoting nuclease/putative transposase [Clostridia bacterium]|nr:Rpn family recombination-promoting nuclease/putative transposase [Clostridia bacterium]